MKYRFSIYLLPLFIAFIVFSERALAEKISKSEQKLTQEIPKKTYSEEEFKSQLSIELEKLLKKVGQAHLVDFSKELLEKEEGLKSKELILKKQEEELAASRDDFKRKVIEFQETQKKFLGCIDEQGQKENKRVSQMVEIISGMKPQSAAEVLAVQDPDLSVRILGELESSKASKIFNLMNKEVSARLQKQFMQMKK